MKEKDAVSKSDLRKFVSSRNLRILSVEVNTPVGTKQYDSSTGLPTMEHTGEVYINIVARKIK
jgi:hypothetical protein